MSNRWKFVLLREMMTEQNAARSKESANKQQLHNLLCFSFQERLPLVESKQQNSMLSLRCLFLWFLFASPAWTFQSARTRRPWRRPTSPAPSSSSPKTMILPSRGKERHRHVLRYKNHLEVQLDLAMGRTYKNEFNSPNQHDESTRKRMRRPWMSLFLLFGRWWHGAVWNCRQLFAHSCRATRRFFQKYTIYVLECQDGKYYVGSTSHKRQRWRQHWSGTGQGAAWTRRHAPIRVVFQHKRVPALYYLGLEAKVTAEWMLKHGVNNVRGAMFAETRKYTLDDLEALTGFLGHYLDLSYHQVESVLLESLPASDNDNDKVATPYSPRPQSRGRRRRKRMVRPSDVCFRCGAKGHWAAECPH